MNVTGTRSRASLVAATLVVSLVVAGCGGSDSDSSGGGTKASEGAGEPAKISIGLPVPVTDYSVVLLAEAEGFFEKHGVDVEIKENLGADALNDLASGSVDLLMYATTAALTLNAKGQKVTAIYGFELDPGSALVGGKKVTSLAQLQAMDKCTIATGPQGSQGYGYAVTYKKQLGLKCELAQSPSQDVQLARVASGNAQATVTNYTGALNTIRASGGHMLVNPLDKGYRERYQLPPEYLTGVIFGKADTVKDKGPALVKFLQGVNDAAKIQTPENAERVAAADAKFEMFKSTPPDALLEQVKAILPYNGAQANPVKLPPDATEEEKAKLEVQPGYITPSAWTDGLDAFVTYGLTGYDPKAPAVSYESIVDMSYLTQAFKP